MDFKQQYKTEMQHIVPSEEQSERIRARVYEEIQKPREVTKHKKPLPLKVIAITGASAACLVLAATFTLHFTLKSETFDNVTAGATLNEAYDNRTVNYITAPAMESQELNEGTAGGGMDATTDFIAPVTAPGKSLQEDVFSYGNDAALRIELNEELSECMVYNGDVVKTYALSNEAELTHDDEKLLTKIPKDRSSLDEALFVYIEGGKIWIYDREMNFLGAFVETA